MLVGIIGTGLSKLLLGLGQRPGLWAIASFGAAFHNPLIMSSYMAVWYNRVAPELQGRVFAADYLMGTLVMLSATLVAGPLADQVFESWMQRPESPFQVILGTGAGSGMALLQIWLALGMIAIGVVGLSIPRLRRTARI